MLKTTLKIIAVVSLLTAGSHNLTLSVQAAEQVIGRVIGLEPIYTTRTIQTPHQVCNAVQVSSNNNSNFLQGAIIGGIIGNSLRGGSQIRNRNTGALIGAFIGSNQSNGQGVRQEKRCLTQYNIKAQSTQMWQNENPT